MYVGTKDHLTNGLGLLAQCQTLVEQAEQACLPPDTRWKMYRNQPKTPGRSWRYFLTGEEYKNCSDGFPFIREKRPWLHKDAITARDEYRNVEWFFPYYWKLYRAASDASLSLDRQCNLVIHPKKESFLALLLDEAAKAAVDKIIGDVTEFALGKELAGKIGKFLGVLDRVMLLAEIWDCERRRKLVNEQRGKMHDEALRRKLSLLMDVMAKELAKKKPGTDRVKWKGWLVHQYLRFEPIRYKYLDYVYMDQSLDPNFPTQPTIRAAP